MSVDCEFGRCEVVVQKITLSSSVRCAWESPALAIYWVPHSRTRIEASHLTRRAPTLPAADVCSILADHAGTHGLYHSPNHLCGHCEASQRNGVKCYDDRYTRRLIEWWDIRSACDATGHRLESINSRD